MFNKHLKIRFSIKAKLILLSGVLAIGSIVVVGFFHILYSRQMLEKRITSDLLILVDSRADQIASITESNLHLVEMIASRTPPRVYLAMRERKDPLAQAQRIDTQKNLKDALDACSLVYQIDVLDLNGEVVASTNIDQIGAELASSDFFSKGKKETYIGDLYPKAGAVLIDIALPLIDPESSVKRIIGVMRVVLLTENIYNVLADYSDLGDTGELVLGKVEGQDIIFLNSLRHKADSAFKFKVPLSSSLAEPMRRALKKEFGFVSGLDYRGEHVLAAYKYIPIGGWGLVIKVDIKEAFAPVKDLLKYSWLVIYVVIILSILAAFIFAGYITRPIKKLHEGIERVRKGDFDFRVGMQTHDEIGQLSRSFDEMLVNLKKITASRNELNKEIVERKKVQETLREEKIRFMSIFNTTFQFTGLMTPDGILTEANKSAVDFTGLRLEEVINRPFWETHWWQGNEERVQKLKESIRLAASGKFIRYEVELQGAGDTTAIFDFSIKPAFGSDGKVTLLIPEGRDITERKKAEVNIDTQKKFLERVIESLKYPFYVINVKDYTIVMANSAAKFGDLAKRSTCYALTHKRDNPCTDEHVCPFKEVLRTKKSVITEHIHNDEEGNKRYVEVYGHPIFDNEGKVIQIIEYTIDITERKKAQEVLVASENKFRKLFDESNDAIIIADPQTKAFVDCNKKAQEMSGYSKQELLSMRADQLHPEDRVNETMEGFKKQAAGMGIIIESEILTKDKKRVAVSINAAAMEVDGKPYIMGVFRDISEAKRAETVLRDNEMKLKAMFESSNDAIMLLTEKGFFDCNRRTIELFGFNSKEEFVKVHPADISPPTQPNGQDSYSLAMVKIKTALEQGGNRFEWMHRRKDGIVFPADVTLTAFEFGDKKVLQAIVRDLSESKKLEEIRRLAQLGELVSSIAHEVNNPLMIISGNAQLCQMEDLKNDAVKDNLKIIVDQCERAKSIIQRMLVFSRPGKRQVKEMDINESLEFATKLIEHQYSIVNVKIIRQFAPGLPLVKADEKQMQEVFLNLIRNAAEAMPEGGTLTITTSLDSGFMRLDFADTGFGMSGEVMDKIFYPFFTTKEKGTGLGLSVSQSIIKIHGGEIKYKSKPGEGTVATVLLPIT